MTLPDRFIMLKIKQERKSIRFQHCNVREVYHFNYEIFAIKKERLLFPQRPFDSKSDPKRALVYLHLQ